VTKTKAVILTCVAMIASVLAASFGLGFVGAKDEVVVAVILFIGFASAFAVSEVIAHYARRESRRRRSV